MVEVHPPDLIRERLEKRGHARVPDGGLDAVFVAEVGQAHDEPVKLSPVGGKERREDAPLFGGLHRAVTRGRRIGLQKLRAVALRRRAQFLPGRVDDAAGEKAAVCQ